MDKFTAVNFCSPKTAYSLEPTLKIRRKFSKTYTKKCAVYVSLKLDKYLGRYYREFRNLTCFVFPSNGLRLSYKHLTYVACSESFENCLHYSDFTDARVPHEFAELLRSEYRITTNLLHVTGSCVVYT